MNAHKMGASGYLEEGEEKEDTMNSQSTSKYFLSIGSRERANTRRLIYELS